MHGCMVYAECALRWQQFHVAPEQPCYNQTVTKWVFKMAFFECFLCWHLGFITVTRMRNTVGSQVLRLFLIMECTTEAAYWLFIFSTLSSTKSFRKMVLQRMLSVVCLSLFLQHWHLYLRAWERRGTWTRSALLLKVACLQPWGTV